MEDEKYSDWYPVILAGLMKTLPQSDAEVEKVVRMAITITKELLKQLNGR